MKGETRRPITRLCVSTLFILGAFFHTIGLIGYAEAAPPPSVTITKVTGLQPGWVRVTVAYEANVVPSFKLIPTCESPTVPQSVDSSTALVLSSPKEAFLDLRDDSQWLQDNMQYENLPCSVTNLQVDMLNGSTVLATTNKTIAFPMDVPFEFMSPSPFRNYPYPGSSASVALQRSPGTSRWAAYPPRIIEIDSASGNRALVEVEELPARGSVGLRRLATFNFWSVYFELGGGAEIFPGWGIDVDRLGITKDLSPVEIAHSGSNLFPYPSNSIEPPILSLNPTLQVLPWLPLFDDATYFAEVLDNRGAVPCFEGGCLDAVYNQANHSLDAVNGAVLRDLDLGPVPDPPEMLPLAQQPLILPAYEAQMVQDLNAALKAVQSNTQLPPGQLKQMESPSRNPQFPIIDLNAKTLSSSVVPAIPGLQQTIEEKLAYTSLRGLSPQELNMVSPSFGNLPIVPEASCVINSTHDGVTSPISRCLGFSSGFRCPTVGDPLRPEDLPSAPGSTSDLSLFNTIPPYYASRDNYAGTCGSHAATQYYEALLDRYTDDLAPKRVIYVDGLPVTVPVPRVAWSVSSGLWDLYAWVGTHAGDPDIVAGLCLSDTDCLAGGVCCVPGSNPCSVPTGGSSGQCRVTWPGSSDPNVEGGMPVFLDAYWPAREGLWNEWAASSDVNGVAQNQALARCKEKGFWFSSFCIGQGQPSPGVYRNYSDMVETFGKNPLSDVPWSLGNSYFNLISNDIPLDDRDAALQAVIGELQKGLPVLLGFSSGTDKQIPDGSNFCSSSGNPCTSAADCAGGETCDPEKYGLSNGVTWFLPPELGACERSVLDDTFGPKYGHAVNIVGYSVEGTLAKPDPFNSYFIIENNWGKDAGYRSFFYMNFAAFKYLANTLTTYRLDASCYSEACKTRPPIIIPPVALKRFLYPPDPEGPVSKRYQELIQQFLPYLGGQHTFANTPPLVPGIVSDFLPTIPEGRIGGTPVGIIGIPGTGGISGPQGIGR